MKINKNTLHLKKLPKTTTLEFTIKVTNEFKIRLAIAKILIYLSGWILGSTTKIIEGDNACDYQ